MSELYLVLRRRLEDVTDWVEIGTPTLHNARKALGLSYEAMGRKLNVAAKTWERWEKAGRVPRHELPRVAEMLELEIEWPVKRTVAVDEDQPHLEDLLGRAIELLEELVAQQQERPGVSSERRG